MKRKIEDVLVVLFLFLILVPWWVVSGQMRRQNHWYKPLR